MMIDGREKVTDSNPSLDHLFAAPVSRTDHLSRCDIAAAEEERCRARPMVASGLSHSRGGARSSFTAAGLIRNLGGPPEFSRDNDQHSLVQSPLVQIFD